MTNLRLLVGLTFTIMYLIGFGPAQGVVKVERPQGSIPYKNRNQILFTQLGLGYKFYSNQKIPGFTADWIPQLNLGIALRPWMQVGLQLQSLGDSAYLGGIRIAWPYIFSEPYVVPFVTFSQGNYKDLGRILENQWGLMISLFMFDDTSESFLVHDYGIDGVFLAISTATLTSPKFKNLTIMFTSLWIEW